MIIVPYIHSLQISKPQSDDNVHAPPHTCDVTVITNTIVGEGFLTNPTNGGWLECSSVARSHYHGALVLQIACYFFLNLDRKSEFLKIYMSVRKKSECWKFTCQPETNQSVCVCSKQISVATQTFSICITTFTYLFKFWVKSWYGIDTAVEILSRLLPVRSNDYEADRAWYVFGIASRVSFTMFERCDESFRVGIDNKRDCHSSCVVNELERRIIRHHYSWGLALCHALTLRGMLRERFFGVERTEAA